MFNSHSVSGFYKKLFLIAVPITLQQLMQTFVNMLDTIMVGQLGAVEIAAVGLGNQIFFMLNMILFGISSGGSVFIAQFWGKKDLPRIHQTLGIMIFLATIISVLFTFAAAFIPEILISFYSKDTSVISFGAKYLRSVCLSYPIMAIGFAFQFAFRGTEHVKLPMIATIISFFFNAILNFLLIFGADFSFAGINFSVPALNVTGAGLATLISRCIETSILLIFSYAKKYEVCTRLKNIFSFDTSFFAKFSKIALPVIFNEALWGFGMTTENAIFAHAGTAAIAAFNITGTISQLTWVLIIGCGNGAGIIIGKYIGSGDEKSARSYATKLAVFMPTMATFIAFLLYPLGLSLPHLFKVDISILHQAQLMLLTLACFYPFNAFNMCFIVGVCRAGGDTKYAAFHDLFWMWVIAIPAGFFTALCMKWMPWQVYGCLLSENLFKATAGFFRLRSGKWLNNLTS